MDNPLEMAQFYVERAAQELREASAPCHQPATKRDLDEMEKRLRILIQHKDPHFDYSISVSNKQQKVPMPLQLKINDEQKVNVALNPVTPRGKPVKLDGKPEWSVVDGDSTLVVADDGMSADLVSADTPGVTNFMVQADADLGEGVDTISDTIQLTVIDPEASSLGLVAGTPVDKAAPPISPAAASKK